MVRSDRPVDDSARRKISLFCDVEPDAVINAVDVPNIYAVPLALHEAGLDAVVCRELGLETPEPELDGWADMVTTMAHPETSVTIGIVGKYVDLPDAYLSVVEALRHGALASGAPSMCAGSRPTTSRGCWRRRISKVSTGSSSPADSESAASRERSKRSAMPGKKAFPSSACVWGSSVP